MRLRMERGWNWLATGTGPRTLLLGVCLAGTAMGQTPTKLAGHSLGETLAQWQNAERVSKYDYCPKAKKGSIAELMGTTIDCMSIEAAEQGKRSTIMLADRKIGATAIGWVFENAVLAEIIMQTPHPDMPTEIAFLTERFGKPTHSETGSFQNGYGATFNLTTAYWKMPDGLVVVADERMMPTRLMLSVILLSGPEFEKRYREKLKNPY